VTTPGAKGQISPRLPNHGLECMSFDAIRTPNAFLFVSFFAPLIQVSPPSFDSPQVQCQVQ
jgi:hypothetical protein